MRATLIGRFLVVVAVASAAAPAEAQIGGMMRRATHNPFTDPAVVFISQEQLGRFQKALQYEIDQRNQLRKALASQKSQQEFQACSQGVAMSPEAMKLVQDWADSSARSTGRRICSRGHHAIRGDRTSGRNGTVGSNGSGNVGVHEIAGLPSSGVLDAGLSSQLAVRGRDGVSEWKNWRAVPLGLIAFPATP